jgi:methionine aminotransferase
VTGWKVGAVAAPAALTAELRKVHQFNVFSVNTPMQHALAAYMEDPAPVAALASFFGKKRDRFRAGLAGTGLRLLPCEGSYFQCVDYGALRHESGESFCRHLVESVGVAAIPLSSFYASGYDPRIVRFCFAKRDETLDEAVSRLARLG